MSTPTDIERISYGGPTGSIVLGRHRQVIQSVGATRTLLAKESGALCLFDRAAGVVYTLPTPVEGMQYEFLATVEVTSNAYKVITASITTQFLKGNMTITKLAAAMFNANADGTSNHVAISSNGTTTGGLIGSSFRVTAISATQWGIEGSLVGSGTLADPFAAS
jgi:hypothetical protein